jgi:hypothetical protein
MLSPKIPLVLVIILASCSPIGWAEGNVAQELTGEPKPPKPVSESTRSARPEDLQEGMRLLDADQPADALALFRKYLLSAPKSPQALLLEATALSSLKKDAEAALAFKQAIIAFQENGKDSELAHAGLGTSLLSQNRTDDAIHQFQIADGLSPNNGVIEVLLARAYLTKQNPYYAQLALKKIEKAQSVKFSPEYLPLFKARALELVGRTDEAEKCLEDVMAHLGIGDEQKKSQLQSVIDHLKRAKEPRPGPVAPDRRHYNLSSSPLFVVVKIDQREKLVTIATADGKDPDRGHQDGENDGYFTMPQAEFDLQTRLKDGTYVLKE